MPVGSLEKIDGVNPQRLLGLPHLPLPAPAVPLQVLTEPTGFVWKQPWFPRNLVIGPFHLTTEFPC